MRINTSTIYVVLISVVLASGIIALAIFTPPGGDAAASSRGQLTFSEAEWDFGTISMKNGLAVKEIDVTNPSKNPIAITRMETSCMCTTVQLVHEDGTRGPMKGMVGHAGSPAVSETIAPGERATIRVQFDPNAHGPNATGPITRNVSLQTDSVDQAGVIFQFSGNVIK